MHRKKRRSKLKIQGNFYPMTTMAAIETKEERLTLLTSESHGVASVLPGKCIVMVVIWFTVYLMLINVTLTGRYTKFLYFA